jgi:hypothetical protein
MSAWAKVVLDPGDADGENTLSLDDVRRRWLAELRVEIDNMVAELGLSGEQAWQVRAVAIAKAETLLVPKFDRWESVARARLQGLS